MLTQPSDTFRLPSRSWRDPWTCSNRKAAPLTLFVSRGCFSSRGGAFRLEGVPGGIGRSLLWCLVSSQASVVPPLSRHGLCAYAFLASFVRWSWGILLSGELLLTLSNHLSGLRSNTRAPELNSPLLPAPRALIPPELRHPCHARRLSWVATSQSPPPRIHF